MEAHGFQEQHIDEIADTSLAARASATAETVSPLLPGEGLNGHVSPQPGWTETDRLVALGRYRILDTPPERAFDDIVQLAAQICKTPMASFNLLTHDRLWFKASVRRSRA